MLILNKPMYLYLLTRLIYQSAIENNLQYYIPTYNSVPDMTFSLPPLDTPRALASFQHMSVLAGHFEWGVWKGLPSYTPMKRRVRYGRDAETDAETDADTDSDIDADAVRAAEKTYRLLVPRIPSCFMMGRHPVDRVISYYYQRCYSEPSCNNHYHVRFGDLTVDDMYYIVVLFRQAKYLSDGETLMLSDDGTHESMCRAALGEKTTTGQLVQDLLDKHGGSIPNPGDISIDKHQEAISNANNCVIGLLEEWELSKEMMKYWFPWMKILKTPPPSTKSVSDNSTSSSFTGGEEEGIIANPHLMKSYDGKETVLTIDPQIRQLIEELIPCDMKLYRNMLLRFEKQKRHLVKERVLASKREQ
jgi:hypothetical protein